MLGVQRVTRALDNDELVNNLVVTNTISSPLLEKVFRAVDRGNYYPPASRHMAYTDLAFTYPPNNLHLSSPSVYAMVMESLELEPNISFLNIGSGSGYFNTMVGLILSPYGINHGVELHRELVEYSCEKLDEFKKECDVLGEFEFCEPQFAVGNCLRIVETQLYDRVYCGARCQKEYIPFMKNLLKINGMLVIPTSHYHVLKIRRVSETEWVTRTLTVTAPYQLLVPPEPNETDEELVKLPEMHTPSLLDICRLNIRREFKTELRKQYPQREHKRRQLNPPRYIIAVPIHFENPDEDMVMVLNENTTPQNFSLPVENKSTFTKLISTKMRDKINQLPLPNLLIDYVGYNSKG